MKNVLNKTVVSFYRSYIREMKQLPHVYLRQFFRIKVVDDIRAIIGTSNRDGLQSRKLKRMTKELRTLQVVNSKKGGIRNRRAFAHVLDLAYGRKGRLKWEIMKPLLSDPTTTPPARIIPSVEKSRPPVYSPEMMALLMSSSSRTSKVFEKSELLSPPALPEQANASSDAAQLLGRLCKRREVNIRWRFFTSEWKKTLPPLAIAVWEKTEEGWHVTSSTEALARAGIRGNGMQGSGIWEALEKLPGPQWKPSTTRLEQRRQRVGELCPTTSRRSFDSSPLPSRWVRRRYQELLGRTPILTFSPSITCSKQPADLYAASLAPNAINRSNRFPVSCFADSDDLAWIHDGRNSPVRERKQ